MYRHLMVHTLPRMHAWLVRSLTRPLYSSGQEESGAELCQKIMKLYLEAGYKTQIIPAAFQTIEEVLPLSNMHHMTMSPALLRELAKTENSKASAFGSQSPSSISSKEVEPEYHRSNYINDEAAFRQQLLRNQAVVEAKTNAVRAFHNPEILEACSVMTMLTRSTTVGYCPFLQDARQAGGAGQTFLRRLTR